MKRIISHLIQRKGRIILGLSTLLYLTLIIIIVGQTTYSYYKTQFLCMSDSARVAMWSVDVAVASDNVYVTSSGTQKNWSNTYRVDIKNNSEVLACYGYDDTNLSDGDGTYHSLLILENLPQAISRVRLLSAENGEVALDTNQIANNDISIVMDGILEAGQTKTYYVQFAVSDTDEYEFSKVKVKADFRFEQAFERKETLVSVSTN